MYRTFRDRGNVIDARFIDIHSGMYMDITALTDQSIGRPVESKKILSCKSPHWYRFEDIFPLKASKLMGVNVWRPNNPIAVLAQEYSFKSMTNRNYKRYKFTDQKMWVKG